MNVFTVDSGTWNSAKTIAFDVPYDSYIIINITGSNVVFDGTTDDRVLKEKNVLYPISRVELLEKGISEEDEALVVVGKDYCKDEEGYVKTFAKLLNGNDRYWDRADHILYNLPSATTFTLKGNWVGSILAPNAAGSDAGKDGKCNGHLSGSLVCKSYEGYQEFGGVVSSVPLIDMPKVTIKKIDAKTNENLAGAILQIRDLDGKVLYQWESTDEPKTVELIEGNYLLYEISAPENYSKVSQVVAFEVKANGKIAKKTTPVESKLIESVPVPAYQIVNTSAGPNPEITNYIKNYENENNKRINKISFKPDTSRATYRADWGLDMTVGTVFDDDALATWVETRHWSHTEDGKEEVAYIPAMQRLCRTRATVMFYRGSNAVSDVKMKEFTIYYDQISTQTVTNANTENVDIDGNENVITVGNLQDTSIRVSIKKTDKNDDSVIAGVGFGLYSSEDNELFAKDELIAGGVTNTEGELVLDRRKIPAGKYYVKEISAPVKYAISDEKWEFDAIENDYKKYNLDVENEEAVTTITINKVYKGTTDPVQYAVFVVYAAEDIYNEMGYKIYSKDNSIDGGSTNADGKITFTIKLGKYNTKPGKYYIKENGGPTNLVFSPDTKYNFEVKQNVEDYVFNVENDFTKVDITKVDKESGEKLPGVKLKLTSYDKSQIYDSWTTTDEPHRVEKLYPGRYKIIEEESPDGYASIEDFEFDVVKTADVQEVRVENESTKLKVEKIDKNDGEAVVGAKLKILDENGIEKASWTTTEEPYLIEKLPIGKYTLVETEAPEGYIIADSVPFEIEDTNEVQEVQMEEDFIKLKIEKLDAISRKRISNAKLKLLDSEGNEIASWTTTEEPYYIEKIPAGEYTIVEVEEAEGYIKSKNVKVVIDKTGEVQIFEQLSEKINEETPEDTSSGESENTSYNTESEKIEEKSKNKSIRTEDNILVMIELLVFANAVLFGTVIWWKK